MTIINMTAQCPIEIDPLDWPIIAEVLADGVGGSADQADRTWYLRVLQHKDGRRIVYGVQDREHHPSFFAGYLVDRVTPNAAETIGELHGGRLCRPDNNATVRAIIQVAIGIGRSDLGPRCIWSLPAERLT